MVRFTRDCFEKPDLNFFFCVVNALNVAFELLNSEKTEFDEDEQTSIDILKSVDFMLPKDVRQAWPVAIMASDVIAEIQESVSLQR